MPCSAFNSAFVANVGTFFFLSKSALFMNPDIAGLSTKFLLFMLLSAIILVHLLYYAAAINLDSTSDILAS